MPRMNFHGKTVESFVERPKKYQDAPAGMMMRTCLNVKDFYIVLVCSVLSFNTLNSGLHLSK